MNRESLLSCPKTLMGKLQPNSKRLQQLIKEHGVTWEVKDATDGPKLLQCFDNNWGFQIQSLDGKHFRNVLVKDIKIP